MSSLRPAKRQAYVRPMGRWWQRDPFFVRYMWREATALAVVIYAIIGAWGLVRLSQGEAAWSAWLAAMQSPLGLALNVVLLIAMLFHTWTWFEVMPKTMPAVYAAGQRVADATITRAGLAAAVLASLATLAFFWSIAP